MNLRRVLALARRVMRQISRDRRTVGLLVFAPMLVLTLAAILFRTDPAAIPLGVVDEDITRAVITRVAALAPDPEAVARICRLALLETEPRL